MQGSLTARVQKTALVGIALVAALQSSVGASATPDADLSVASIEITQGFQAADGTTPLVARNATMVRVTLSLNGGPSEQQNVDAVLRIYSNGVEIATSPVYSSNGPIVARVVPSNANLNDTINFHCLPPQSNDLDFVVTVDPFRRLNDPNRSNNSSAVLDRACVCRAMVDLAYTGINYTLGGGLPDPLMIEPGNGDGFVRGIYKTGDWNYHRSPLPPPVVSLDIHISNLMLLNTLNDIRQNQIPAAGYTRPEFIYGWLKGSPFASNGQAIATPGSAAFGNTDPSKFQRTFAHELGHCWGQPHNTQTIGVAGVDVEHQLRNPLGLPIIKESTKKDVMFAAQITQDAWVGSTTTLDCINDLRSACTSFQGGSDDSKEGAASSFIADATSLMQVPVLRICGAHDHVARVVRLDHAMTHELVPVTADDAHGNVVIESYDCFGALLTTLRVNTLSARQCCSEGATNHESTSLYVNLPRYVGGRESARIVVRERNHQSNAHSHVLAELTRSASAPLIANFTVGSREPLDETADEVIGTHGSMRDTPDLDIKLLVGSIAIHWNASDLDGDALVADILYSPDGGDAWWPVVVGETTGSFVFDSSDLPASRGANARFRLRVSDGFNVAHTDTPAQSSMMLGNSQPPDVHVVAPDTATTFPAGASVILHGSAWDIDDQLLPESSLTWTSSLEGALGTGRLLVVRQLLPGVHIITLRGTDSDELFSERTITITIVPREFNSADLNGDTIVNAADLVLLLNGWGETGMADLDLNGWVNAWDMTLLMARWNVIE